MEKYNDNNSTLAKKSGIPYTTIDGLFKRGWEKAQTSTIMRICDYYNVPIDYMVYGTEKLSTDALIVAAKYDTMSDYGRAIIDAVLDQEEKMYNHKRPSVTCGGAKAANELVADYESSIHEKDF